jgi:hypothetical protein
MKYAVCLFGSLFISIVVGFALAFYFIGLPSSFYDFNLMQLVMPFVQIAIAIGLAIFVNVKLSNKAKRNELLVSKMEDYETVLGELHGHVVEYMETKNAHLEPKILALMTKAARTVEIFKQIDEYFDFKLTYSPIDMKKDLLLYKKRLTSEAFKQEGIQYTSKQKREVETVKHEMEKRITLQKMSLYT